MAGWIAFGAFLVSVLSGCAGPSSGEFSEKAPLSGVQIVYAANVGGEIEPCGCRGNPSGGVARRWNAQKEEVHGAFLSLDSGDLFYKSAPSPFLLRNQWDYQASVLAEANNALKLDFFAPGELDFASGLEEFLKLRSKSKFAYLSANIVEPATGRLLLQESAIIERFGKRIGLFGVIDEDLPLADGVSAMPHLAAARRVARELRPKVDVVIALTHLGLEKDKELAAQVPGIDAIFGSHTNSFLTMPVRIGNTLLFHQSYRGQHMGVFLDGKNVFYQLDERYSSAQGRQNPMDALVEKAKREIARLNAKTEEDIFGEPAALRPSASAPPRPLVPSSTRPVGSFKTFASCAQCHAKQYEFVKKTPHSHAYRTLMKAHQNKNLDCLKCHTLGLGQPGGYSHVNGLVLGRKGEKMDPEVFAKELPRMTVRDLKKVSKAFLNVQCETCHAMAAAHPAARTTPARIGSETCVACHTPEQAPKWYRNGKLDAVVAARKLRMMACPK